MSIVNTCSEKDFLVWIDGHVNWCDSPGKPFVDNINLDVTENFRAPLLPLCAKRVPPRRTSSPLRSASAVWLVAANGWRAGWRASLPHWSIGELSSEDASQRGGLGWGAEAKDWTVWTLNPCGEDGNFRDHFISLRNNFLSSQVIEIIELLVTATHLGCSD